MVLEDWDIAIANSFEAVLSLIKNGADVNQRNERGVTPLHLAARYGKSDIIRLLIVEGADTKAITKHGQTPLEWAKVIHNIEARQILASVSIGPRPQR